MGDVAAGKGWSSPGTFLCLMFTCEWPWSVLVSSVGTFSAACVHPCPRVWHQREEQLQPRVVSPQGTAFGHLCLLLARPHAAPSLDRGPHTWPVAHLDPLQPTTAGRGSRCSRPCDTEPPAARRVPPEQVPAGLVPSSKEVGSELWRIPGQIPSGHLTGQSRVRCFDAQSHRAPVSSSPSATQRLREGFLPQTGLRSLGAEAREPPIQIRRAAPQVPPADREGLGGAPQTRSGWSRRAHRRRGAA